MNKSEITQEFNSEDRLMSAFAAKSVLRTLQRSDSILTYQQFAEAIGLKAESEPWHPRYRQQVTSVLSLLAAVEKQAHEEASPFHRIVNANTGKPGAGVRRDTRLIAVNKAEQDAFRRLSKPEASDGDLRFASHKMKNLRNRTKRENPGIQIDYPKK